MAPVRNDQPPSPPQPSIQSQGQSNHDSPPAPAPPVRDEQPPSPPQPSSNGSDSDSDAEPDSFQSLFAKFSQQWLNTQVTHHVSLTATNSF